MLVAHSPGFIILYKPEKIKSPRLLWSSVGTINEGELSKNRDY